MTTTTETANVSAPVTAEPKSHVVNAAMANVEGVLSRDFKACVLAYLAHSRPERLKGATVQDLMDSFIAGLQDAIADVEDSCNVLMSAPSHTFSKDWGYADSDGTPLSARHVARSLYGFTLSGKDVAKIASSRGKKIGK